MLQYVFGLVFDITGKNKMIAALLIAFSISWLTLLVFSISPKLSVYKEQDRLQHAVVSENARGKATTQVNDGTLIYNIPEFDQNKRGVEVQRMTDEQRAAAMD